MREIFEIRLVGLLVMTAFVTVLLLNLMGSLSAFSSDNAGHQAQLTAELIDKAMVQCYALEGSYPPNLEYLADNYGLMLYNERFIYYFEPIASNIKPVVQVIPR